METKGAVTVLGALAQETRLEIFRLLMQSAPAGLPAGAIGERLRLAPPTLSFHLNQLRFAGLVNSRRQGRSIIYTANLVAMAELLGYLTRDCCGGRPEICAPLFSSGSACSAPAGAAKRARR